MFYSRSYLKKPESEAFQAERIYKSGDSMFFYLLLFVFAALIVFLLLTIRILDSYRKKIVSAWNEIMRIWSSRYDAAALLIDYARGRNLDNAVFYGIAQAKSRCYLAKKQATLIDANKIFGNECSKLLALIKTIPETENDTLFQDIHMQIISLEEKLAFTRSFYDDYVKKYNNLVQHLPTSLAAVLCKYKAVRPYN